jgi:hypothetical protein
LPGSAVSLGMPAKGLGHLELAAKLSSGSALLSIGTRPDVHATAWAAHAHWLLGHDGDALTACREAIKLAWAIGDPYNLAVALSYGSITYQMRHDMSELRDTVGELRELCGRYGFAYYREWALILDGLSRTGEPGIDLARLVSKTSSRRARSRACRTGCRCSPTCWQAASPAPPGRSLLTPRWPPRMLTTMCGGCLR